jgi:hypothetical protein
MHCMRATHCIPLLHKSYACRERLCMMRRVSIKGFHFFYNIHEHSQGGCLSAAWLRNNNFLRSGAQSFLCARDALSRGGATPCGPNWFSKSNLLRARKKLHHELCLSGQITRVIWPACGVWPFDARALIDPLYVSGGAAAPHFVGGPYIYEMDAISRRRHRKNRLLRQYYTPFCLLWARTHTCSCGRASFPLRMQTAEHMGMSKWLNDGEHANLAWFTA